MHHILADDVKPNKIMEGRWETLQDSKPEMCVAFGCGQGSNSEKVTSLCHFRSK
jgi:hypothetical protein